MRFDILTLFPEMFPGYTGQSILNKSIERGLVEVHVHNMRDWAKGRHHKIDDTPYGGGPGMILMVEPVVNCVRDVQAMGDQPGTVIVTTPQGQRLNQPMVEELALNQRMILLCGRYEGFDQRVIDILQPLEISIGDYILNGGEVASMVLVDSLVRMVPGVLGDERSSWDDSFSRGNRMLEYPQYTRPRDFEGHSVPEVLLGGNHGEVERWRNAKSLENTKNKRSDLLDS
ncbi:tRNA (guanosine(37)-N1)-methyltransferase TrmD [Mariniblastus sp.]|jgi:tRNA (guanine37-N1)-methyltransferase|nr:tRNA (guanosine(37)-N1)-methyltransferase TrmD [bacterium]MDA7906360.1 tRNA (guanosine(37)-N1)-methyltransferase TrmD [Mariniblastus sp.]MDA7926014.1 tRNA (guanosine(37)-N1)-methyltransferase TrmD [Mariniblastus sp.]MDB4367995.1 tRNA (guanosine(37)-N1)-methyltransferase TrmD [Mariniblastus sp.]MDB4380264.1 tRNA (guanosine(37)-N1)-methyltransferase TrmD [Mariniblastus sp.]